MNKIMYILTMGKVIRPKINKETNERFCRGCDKWFEQTVENWYYVNGKIRSNFCKTCYAAKRPSTRQRTIDEWRVYSIPGVYANPEQKEMAFKFMRNMGWRYNDLGKLWWKPGIKRPDGTWENMPEDVEIAGSHTLTLEEKIEIQATWEKSRHDWEGFQSKYNVTKNKLESCLRFNVKNTRKKYKRKEGKLRDWKGDIIYRKGCTSEYRANMTPDERLRVIKMVLSGQTYVDVAKYFNRTSASISYQMRKYYGRKT